MALSKEKALTLAMQILTGPRTIEVERLDRLHRAVSLPNLIDPDTGRFDDSTFQIPNDAPPQMKELARKSLTNYLPLLIATYGQVMKVDGYYSKSADTAETPWVWWQRNRMDSFQTGLHRGALQYGTAYATALPGTYGRENLPGPAIKCYSPRMMTAVYRDWNDEWPLFAVAVDANRITLIDEEALYRFGVEVGPFYMTTPSASMNYGTGRLVYLETEIHGIGVCPVVRYRDRNLLAGEESLGIVEPLLTIQDRINETTFQMQVAQYYQAFKQRYVIGWVPKSEKEELKTNAGRIWYLDEDPADVKIDQLEAGAITPYIESRNSAIRDFAAIGQVPAQSLGIDGISNISDATLAGLEAARNRNAAEMTTSLGESHEQLLRLCAFLDGNEDAADDYESEMRWQDFETRSFAALLDGIVKEVSIGMPADIAMEEIPGMTDGRLTRIKQAMQRQQGSTVLAQLAQLNGGMGADTSSGTAAPQ